MLRWVLIALAFGAAAPFVAPRMIDKISNIFVLGYPLSHAFGIMPALLVFLGLGAAAIRLLAIAWHLPFLGAAGIAAVLAATPPLVNKLVDRQAAELAAGDQRKFTRPASLRSLAVLGPNETRCDGLCQRLLLNGQVERLIYVRALDPEVLPAPAAAATSFRMERRNACPAVDLAEDKPDLRLAGETGSDKDKAPAEAMRLAMAGGHCLIVEKATLGDADVALFQRNATLPPSALGSAFGVNGEVVRGERISMFQRDGSFFRETYRWTSVNADKLSAMMLSSGAFNVVAAPSILRRFNQTYAAGPDWMVFLTDMMGFDLTLKGKA